MANVLNKMALAPLFFYFASVVSALPDTSRIVFACTFESLTPCGATLIPPDAFTWTRLAGKTPSLNTGPDYDHTYFNTTTGHYMYTEASEFDPGQVAVLRLPTLTTPSTVGALCLTFWSNMYGMHIGTLNVTQTVGAGAAAQGGRTLWSLSGNQGYSWNQTNITLNGGPGTTSVVSFVGVRGGDNRDQPYGDIAIDDVFVYEGSCFDDPTTTAMPTTTAAPTTTIALTTTTTSTTTTSTTTSPSTTLPTTTSTTTIPSTQTTSPTTTSTTTSPTTTTTPTTTVPTTTHLATTSSTTTTSPTTTSTLTLTVSTTTTTQSSATLVSSTAMPPSTDFGRIIDSTMTSTPSVVSSISSFSGIPGVNSSPSLAVSVNSVATTIAVVAPPRLETNPDGSNKTNSTDSVAAISGNSIQGNPTPKLWNLNEDKMIIILACLGAAILLLLVVVVVISCLLCIIRKRYIVERSNVYYHSDNSTVGGSLDALNTIEGQHAKHIDAYANVPMDY